MHVKSNQSVTRLAIYAVVVELHGVLLVEAVRFEDIHSLDAKTQDVVNWTRSHRKVCPLIAESNMCGCCLFWDAVDKDGNLGKPNQIRDWTGLQHLFAKEWGRTCTETIASTGKIVKSYPCNFKKSYLANCQEGKMIMSLSRAKSGRRKYRFIRQEDRPYGVLGTYQTRRVDLDGNQTFTDFPRGWKLNWPKLGQEAVTGFRTWPASCV